MNRPNALQRNPSGTSSSRGLSLGPGNTNSIHPQTGTRKSLDLTTLELKKFKPVKMQPSEIGCSHISTSPNFLEILPVDCLLKVAGFLPIHARFKGMSTCKQWREILSDRQFWIHIGTSSYLSPISGMISDDFLKKICYRLGKPARTLVLDGCHRITGKVLSTIAVLPSLRSISLKWCDNIIESDLLKHLQIHGRRYEKIDLRGCNKLTGTVLFRECEKRSLSEGLIKSDSVFDWPKVVVNVRHVTGSVIYDGAEDDENLTLTKFKTFEHWPIKKVLDAWMDYTRNSQNILFTCHGRLFHHSLCCVELSEFLKSPIDTLEIHAHSLSPQLIKILSRLPEQAEKENSELFDPLIHPYRSGQAQLRSLYSHSLVVDIESMVYDSNDYNYNSIEARRQAGFVALQQDWALARYDGFN